MTSPAYSPQSFPHRPSVATVLPTRILAFAGPAGAGKSTAAELLRAADPEGTKRISFADPIRAMLVALGLTAAELSEGKHQPHPLLCGKTPRQAMQSLGTEWGRQMIGESIWRAATKHRINRFLHIGYTVVIDDVRFDDEADLIHELGGLVIWLTRPSPTADQPEAWRNHASERGLSAGRIDHSIAAEDRLSLCAQLSPWLRPAV
jgi:deoxynucleotide monophosphate kinase-like protein